MTAPQPRTVAIVGLGYVGTILGVYLAQQGFQVKAIEPRAEVEEALRNGRSHIQEAGLAESLLPLFQKGAISISPSPSQIDGAGTVIVTVGTPLGRATAPDLTALSKAAADIAPYLSAGQLVIIKSTVPPGTTRKVLAPILESAGLRAGSDLRLAYCPERLSEGNALTEVVRLPVIVSGINGESADAAYRFWRSAGLNVLQVKTLEVAELVKLADNLWIDLNIALTNELARVCERLDVDALEVIKAANTLPKGGGNVNFLHPGIGVGGSCLTKDPWFFAEFANTLGVEVLLPQDGRRVNEAVPAHVSSAILAEIGQVKSGTKPRVAVLGYAFKGSTGDTRNTPVRGIIGQLKAGGCDVTIFDPWVLASIVQSETGVSPSESIQACVRDASCVFVASNHPEFRGLEPRKLSSVARGCFVYDGWHMYSPETFSNEGWSYLSPGKQLRVTRR